MIRNILNTYAASLDEFLSRYFNQPEGHATTGQIGNSTEEKPNKMVISLLNVERETSGGINATVKRTDDGYARMQPPLLINLNVMLAAVFEERRYNEALSMLTYTLRFIQSVPKFEVYGNSFTIEIVNLTMQDQNNMWTLLGGQYYPSVVCKIRRLCIDGDSVTAGGTTAGRPIVEM